MALPAAPPIWMAKPITQYASRPQPYTKKFIMYVWFAFFTRVSPDSTMAKPACMNMTRKPQTRVQTKLIATLFCPIWLPASASVGPAFASVTVTSAMVPVMVPPGSPFWRSAAVGALAAASLSSAVAGDTEAGVAAGWAAGPSAYAVAATMEPSARMQRARKFFRRVAFISPTPWPWGLQ